jgi:homoserine kinase type II
MSVYTSISREELVSFLTQYPAGELISFTGIQAGITNTNYFVDTSDNRYVLTIVEHESAEDVEWFMYLLDFLCRANIPCAEPLMSTSGCYTSTLCGKPATLVKRLSGSDKGEVGASDCYLIGETLARMHLACRDYQPLRKDSRGRDWREQTARQVSPGLSSQQQQLLQGAMSSDHLDELPRSIIHADLFRDNVLFEQDHIGGIIDFYYACDGCMLYDLAIVYNDWCRDDTMAIINSNASALLDGYQSRRPFESIEQQAWPDAIRTAALRFWLSRLQDKLFPMEGSLTFIKDPMPFQRLLEQASVTR